MQTLTPSAQEEAEGLQGVVSGVESAAATDPFISGTGPILWVYAGAFLVIFVVVLMLIIRWFVVRPSQRKAKYNPPNYFEPAGEDADITFDEDGERQTHKEKRHQDDAHWADETAEETEISIERGEPETHETEPSQADTRHSGDLNEPAAAQVDEEAASGAPARKKKSAFAGLFSKKPEPESQTEPEESPDDLVEDAPVEDPYFPQSIPERVALASQPDAAPMGDYAQPSNADDARLLNAEDNAQMALQRAEDAERLARDLARANAATERTIALGLQENEAALTAMSERLTALAKDFQSRIDSAPAPLSSAQEHHGNISEAHFAEFADLLGEQFETLRGTVSDAIDRLSRRIDHLPAAAPHAVAPTAARVQLSDLLGDALPAQRYELSRRLTSGRTADACIDMPGSLAPIAIDARFPVESFDAWQRARIETSNTPAAETELRRIVLRHIADAGEKLIIAGETADCALMFVPSEHILSELHAHFPDLVQEGYRAKVWMVAPTSLMATLHTISAVISGAGLSRSSGADVSAALTKELSALRERIGALEAQRQDTDRTALSGVEQPAARHAPLARADDLGDRPTTAAPRETATAGDDKPSFPLR